MRFFNEMKAYQPSYALTVNPDEEYEVFEWPTP